MKTINEVEIVLKEVLPLFRKSGRTNSELALHLNKEGIAIKDIVIREQDGFKPHLQVEYINVSNAIETTYIDLESVDGRTLDEIEKDLIK